MNVDTACPHCDTVFTVRRELLGKRTKCTKCGTPFTIAESAAVRIPPTPPPPEIPEFPQVAAEPTPQPASRPPHAREVVGLEREARQPPFAALRIVARGFEVLAVLVLVVAAILLVMLVIAIIRRPDAIAGAIFASGLAVFWATLIALSLLAFAQIIRLALQIEQNTRETHEACRQLADHLCSIETET